jgi:ribonuclease HI
VTRHVDLYSDGSCHPNPNGFGGWAAVAVLRSSSSPDRDPDNGPRGARERGDRVIMVSGSSLGATTNEMELRAVCKGVQRLQALAREKGRFSVRVWTDSSYTRHALSDWAPGWRRNGWRTSTLSPVANAGLIRATLVEIEGLRNVAGPCRIRKIKGHAGHYYNELADRIAGEERRRLQFLQRG